MNNVLNMMFTLMQVAIANGLQAELSTVASITTPLPNLVVVINSLGSCCLEPRVVNHVGVRICYVDNKFRFLVEEVITNEDDDTRAELDNFWDDCPYGTYNSQYDLFEVEYEDAQDLLQWVINRGRDIKQNDVLSWTWTIA